MNIYEKNSEQIYPVLVANFIHERYSADAETALINNYISDPVKYGDEYRTYQAYREECKARAREICGK